MTEKDRSALIHEIDALVQASQREREALRRATWTAALVSGALLIIVAVFVIVNYQQIKSEWTEEKLSAGFVKELDILNPTASEELQKLGQHLMPVYSEATRQQFAAQRPEIARRILAEVDQLAINLSKDAESRLTDSTDRVTNQTNEIVFGAYPGLKKDAEQEALTKNLRRVTEEAVTAATTDFTSRFAADVLEVDRRLHSFRKPQSDTPTVELEKRFIHLWLRLLDTEIMKR